MYAAASWGGDVLVRRWVTYGGALWVMGNAETAICDLVALS